MADDRTNTQSPQAKDAQRTMDNSKDGRTETRVKVSLIIIAARLLAALIAKRRGLDLLQIGHPERYPSQ
jgi:hypothetical protein